MYHLIDMKWTLMTYMTCTALPVFNCDGLHCLHLVKIHFCMPYRKEIGKEFGTGQGTILVTLMVFL